MNDNANIAVWSPLMDGLVVGTEKGKLYIFRSVISPLSRTRPIAQPSCPESANQDTPPPAMDTVSCCVCYKQNTWIPSTWKKKKKKKKPSPRHSSLRFYSSSSGDSSSLL